MKVFATYNIKGGVGKTAAAVNLAYLASLSGYRTLVWDLDAQGAASFYFRIMPGLRPASEALLDADDRLSRSIHATDYFNLDLIPADLSLRNLDVELNDKKKATARLKKALKAVRDHYDVVFLDCAPTLSTVSDNIFAVADWLLVPLIPTHLSLRAYDQIRQHYLTERLETSRLLPFFSMVDRRKRLHRQLVQEFATSHAELLPTFVPYASQVEQMGEYRAPVNAVAKSGTGVRSFEALWKSVGRRTGLQTDE